MHDCLLFQWVALTKQIKDHGYVEKSTTKEQNCHSDNF